MVLYLSGPAGSGKSTVAQTLANTYGYHRISLGGYCRKAAADLGLPTTRVHLQRIGDAIRAEAHDSAALAVMAWDEVVSRRQSLERKSSGSLGAIATHLLGYPDAVVIDGVRLVAEAEYLRAQGVFGVAVDADPNSRAWRLFSRDGSSMVPRHLTEREAEDLPVDCHICNTGSQEQLTKALDSLHWRLLELDDQSRLEKMVFSR